MQGIGSEDLNKDRCREKDTGNPLMQWVAPWGHGFEFTQAGVRTVQIFKKQKRLPKTSYILESYSSCPKLPLPAPFFSFLLFL